MVLSVPSPHEDLGTRMFGMELPPVGEEPTDTPVPAAFLPFYPVALRLG